jgi:UDP-N-acetyl-D-mannosaminuronate dehydrogenase
VGYSPERINPGDREHMLTNVVKVVAGDTPETLDKVADSTKWSSSLAFIVAAAS